MLDIREILQLLPHRYPFLLVDRVLSIEDEGRVLNAIKNVTFNEPYFPGHFPGLPTMPGVILLEAMAQACGILAIQKSGLSKNDGLILYFAGIDECRFKRPVVPGDQLRFRVELDKQKRDLWKFKAQATVEGELACCADMMCVLKHTQRSAQED
ncbi:3-hydroxyacyl-ACP dehydratase FabZ [Fontimonas sp. SYSU GA230001]|uniref:3-hydroxyacyl-ACP dehydratase FabZ n=1 Tax=Fontimonas sp. SYSU GA230001 TaxID=3142450 RepID=UPI0032B6011E